MVDLSQADIFDDWFYHSTEPAISENNQTSLIPPNSPIISSNATSLPVTKASSLSNNEDENSIKKRKHEQKIDSSESKKTKPTPSYMRRNIRHLFTNDKLQCDTLTALKAEQDRLKRLEEINDNYLQFNYPINNSKNEQECIVLEDDDDENEHQSSTVMKHKSNTNNDDDGNDSDVQCVDGDDDSEVVDDKLTKKLQRLHLDDRVNIPDENGMKNFK
jgi:hypothetical protein